jgi:hypothetical protein
MRRLIKAQVGSIGLNYESTGERLQRCPTLLSMKETDLGRSMRLKIVEQDDVAAPQPAGRVGAAPTRQRHLCSSLMRSEVFREAHATITTAVEWRTAFQGNGWT